MAALLIREHRGPIRFHFRACQARPGCQGEAGPTSSCQVGRRAKLRAEKSCADRCDARAAARRTHEMTRDSGVSTGLNACGRGQRVRFRGIQRPRRDLKPSPLPKPHTGRAGAARVPTPPKTHPHREVISCGRIRYGHRGPRRRGPDGGHGRRHGPVRTRVGHPGCRLGHRCPSGRRQARGGCRGESGASSRQARGHGLRWLPPKRHHLSAPGHWHRPHACRADVHHPGRLGGAGAVDCPMSTTVVGGGFSALLPDVTVTSSRPLTIYGWRVSARNPNRNQGW